MSVDAEIAHYLKTGDHDLTFAAWSGNWLERAIRGHADLKAALIAETERRTAGLAAPAVIPDTDPVAFVRRKVEPMVRGFFPRVEQEAVLRVLERSVVFLTPANISSLLADQRWPRTAWDLANLFLGSVGADLLGPDATGLVGLSEETTCYVSMEYFDEGDPFADFVVHEAAHIFHNCKRATVGLPETRTREWLLDLDFKQRETFACACEAYSRILALHATQRSRVAAVEELARDHMPADERLDRERYLSVLRDAASARNGWRRILSGCSPPRGRRPGSGGQPAVNGGQPGTNTMSEYQYYEFVAVDRRLNEGEMGELRSVSSRAHHVDDVRQRVPVGQLQGQPRRLDGEVLRRVPLPPCARPFVARAAANGGGKQRVRTRRRASPEGRHRTSRRGSSRHPSRVSCRVTPRRKKAENGRENQEATANAGKPQIQRSLAFMA
jgi:hypothetical protein